MIASSKPIPRSLGDVKDTGTKACLRERILGGAYFNEGVCDVNHSVHDHATSSHGSSY